MKRMICMLTVLCLLLTLAPAPVWAATAQRMEKISASGLQWNPLEPKKPTMTEFRKPQITGLEKLENDSTILPPEKDLPSINDNGEYLSMDAAVAELRQQMKNRVNGITINVKTTNEDANDVYNGIFYDAMEHTGEPGTGDNLMWQWGKLSVGDGYYRYRSGDYYYYTLPYDIDYYTTAAQEAELDQAVEALLDELDLYSTSDYDKISGVYEYITENISYDYVHLENPDYDLMYTAYAALVNKTAVCQGYANLFYRLMLELDVDARIVVGWGGGPHAWNIVELEDWYYYVDSTWDAGNGSYWYFLLGSNHFSQDHTDYEDECPFLPDYPISYTDYTPGQPGQLPPPETWPKTGSCGDNMTWKLTEEGLLTISGTGSMWDFEYSDPEWYRYANQIQECVIEEGVTGLGDYAFYKCYSLASIDLPNSLQDTGEGAFTYCESLTSVAIPDGITVIGRQTFAGCTSLTSVSIPASVIRIGEIAFRYCEMLRDVYYGGSPSQWAQIEIQDDNEYLLSATIHYGAEDTNPGPEPTLPEADYLEIEWELLKLANRERYKAGLAPLTTTKALFQATDIRALELMEKYAHERPDGNSFDSVLYDVGIEFRMAGENKDAGCSSAEELINAWMGVSDSRAHILGSNYTHMGVSYKQTDNHTYSTYWDQLFYTDEYCHYTGFRLNVDELTVEQGTALEDMELWGIHECFECGECYLPVLAEYCSAFDPDTLGTQTVTVSGLNYSDTVEITVIEKRLPELDLPECLDAEWEVLRLTNRERHNYGLEPLTTQDILFKAAGIRAEEITKQFEHTRPDGSEFSTVFFDLDYPWYGAGENIAGGYRTPADVVIGWMNSPGHRANILDAEFYHLGVGYTTFDDAYAHYWTQLFSVGWECQYTNLELCSEYLEVEVGTELETIPLWAAAQCTYCGQCYLPILPEYCTGYEPGTPGTYEVTVTCLGKTDKLTIKVLGEEEEEPATASGDANGDGTINSLDVILLRQYLADWDVTPDLTGADANGDGTVNSLDVILLRQYLADWDVTLGKKN